MSDLPVFPLTSPWAAAKITDATMILSANILKLTRPPQDKSPLVVLSLHCGWPLFFRGTVMGCNFAIGLCDDNPEALIKIAQYLHGRR